MGIYIFYFSIKRCHLLYVSFILCKPRYRHEVVEHEGALYVFGGGRSDAACDLTYLPTFLIKERMWVPTKTYPDPVHSTFPQCRRCHVACKFNNCKYSFNSCALLWNSYE